MLGAVLSLVVTELMLVVCKTISLAVVAIIFFTTCSVPSFHTLRLDMDYFWHQYAKI